MNMDTSDNQEDPPRSALPDSNRISVPDHDMTGPDAPTTSTAANGVMASTASCLPPEHQATLDKRKAIQAIMTNRSLTERERASGFNK